jgi:nicotinate-nucleotide--dimethylbenzimidazole phosphoribosyltransferase
MGSSIGVPRPRLDGEPKVRGATRFAADLPVPGLLHGRPVLAHEAHARITGIDATAARDVPGVVAVLTAADLPPDLPIVQRKVAYGSANLAYGPAMTDEQVLAAITVGLEVIDQELSRGLDVVCLGEMGIGNTTAASAIVAAITGLPAAAVTGRGTGIDEPTWRHKVAVIEAGLHLNAPDPGDPLDVLTKVGGLEIAGLVGVSIRAAEHRLPVIVDGFIATAAALVAAELCPSVRRYLIAAHRSAEIGHQVALERLELEPLFALDLRLGEGTGAALALPVVDAALALQDEMATFEQAGVSGARRVS